MVVSLFLFLAASATFDDSFRSGLAALQRDDLPAAVSNLEEAAKLAPANGRVWVALSRAYWKLHDVARADDAAAKAASLGSGDRVVLQSLAIYYFDAAQPLLNAQKFAQAIAVLEPANRQVPDNAQLQLALGVAYYGVRRFEDAAGAFLRTIAIAPEIDQPYIFLGEFLDQIPQHLPEISRHFADYEKAHPDNYKSYLLHARVLNAQSIEPANAERLLRKAVAMHDPEPRIHWELADLLDRMHRYAEAVTEFERTVALNPSDAAAHYRLARDYDRLGKHDAAVVQRGIHAQLVKDEGAVR